MNEWYLDSQDTIDIVPIASFFTSVSEQIITVYKNMEIFEIVSFEIIKQVGESQIPKAHFEILNLFNYF